jgi:phosphoglycolate phosphatase
MYKAIIFDLDGTLLNTSRDICKVLNNSLSAFSLPNISLEKTIEYVGNGAKKLVERAVPEQNKEIVNEVYKHYSAHFAVCDNNLTTLYEGEEEVLKTLKRKGCKLAIITNKPQKATDGVYLKHLSEFNFDLVLGQSETFPLKPEADSTLYAIKKMGVNKSDCLFVGDGETDVLTAKNAGVDCLSVLWGYRDYNTLKKAGAAHFAKSYTELLNFVICGK